jgi:hypothetical protein
MLFLGGRMDKFRAADSKGSVADHQVKKETRFQAIFVRRGPRIFVRFLSQAELISKNSS